MQQLQEHHIMELEKTHPSGAEEWCCSECGRRFLMQWSPFSMMVLENGNEQVRHSGSKGGLQIGSHQTHFIQSEPDTDETWPEAMPGAKLIG